LAFEPNAGARALAGRRSNIIGLFVDVSRITDMASLLPFIETITAEARARDFDVVLVTDDSGTESIVRLSRRSLVDAIVLMDIRFHDDRLETAASLGIPVVLIGIAEDNHGLDAVDFEIERAAELAVDELANTGHQHVIVLGEAPEVMQRDYGFVTAYENGALAAGEARGLDIQVVRPQAMGWAGIRDLTNDLLANRKKGLGIIARTPLAIGWVLQLLLIERLVPGQDVALVAVCTDDVAESFSVPVTNVSPEPEKVSRVAMERVFNLLSDNPQKPAVRLVSPRLTRRATTPQV
ncbi:MAG: LacI family DNA-binding transcriptional regulator, partial [Propionicimonas sp.]|nr:LacI family DNA-binding transcriptional regulator [Propionicimonas sp.]